MRLLLIDTCGETGSSALAENGEVLREHTFEPRAASAELVPAIRKRLAELGWALRTLDAVCVVNGPGSFTGVRVGLAAAKGLCEVAGLRLVTLSRLEVLLAAGGTAANALAVLDAGRGEFYVRLAKDGSGEVLWSRGELESAAKNARLLVAEERLLSSLQPLEPAFVPLSAAAALGLAAERLARGGGDSVGEADANYVRSARTLYGAGKSALQERKQP